MPFSLYALGDIKFCFAAVDVTGYAMQQGLSGVIVNVRLAQSSGSACVDEYFAIVDGFQMNNTIGPFSVDLCSSPGIPDVRTVGTSRNCTDRSNEIVDFTASLTLTVSY